jgi:pyruvate dehydrogenase E1 component alpha subunit
MVGGGAALAAGIAFAHRLRGDGAVTFAFFGDGAMGEGAMHETLNLARLWRAPVVFVCESNSEPGEGQANGLQAARELVDLAAVHQIAAEAVEASDPVALARTFAAAAEAVRAGEGPRFLEGRSAPWPGNSFMPDPAAPRFDLAAAAAGGVGWDAVDPVAQALRAALAEGMERAAVEALDAAIREEMATAAERAAAAPAAPVAAATEDVWGTR